MIKLMREEPSIDEVLNLLKGREVGGITSFIGIVRGETAGKTVEALEIEVYEEMTLKELEKIRAEALNRFGVKEVVIIHRYGRLKVGDVILVILVAAPHRYEAFLACRYVLEELKRRAPIWKREFTSEGEMWVEGEERWKVE
jgi:molybdopterin synthase catalytic subunit